MTTIDDKTSRKTARSFIEAFERSLGRADFDQLQTLYDEGLVKAEEYKNYPHYLIALVRSPYRLREVLSGYSDGHAKVRKIMLEVYGEEKTNSFLIGIEKPA